MRTASADHPKSYNIEITLDKNAQGKYVLRKKWQLHNVTDKQLWMAMAMAMSKNVDSRLSRQLVP